MDGDEVRALFDREQYSSVLARVSDPARAKELISHIESDKRMAAIDEIQKQFAKMISTGELRVTARRGELVLSLPSEVLFPSGSAELSKQGEYAVVEVGAVLKRFPGRRYLVVGHTDNHDLKPGKDQPCAAKDNLQLSTERALTVTRVLVTAGMDAKNLLPSGAGEKDPIASNAT